MRNKVDTRKFAYIPGPGGGTVTALTSIQLHVLHHLDSCPGGVRIAAVDLSKAFDQVTHGTILQASHNFSLPRDIVLFITSYLRNRFQRVRINSTSSNFVEVTSGVPQGSVIGPILFSLVIDSFSAVSDR